MEGFFGHIGTDELTRDFTKYSSYIIDYIVDLDLFVQLLKA